MSKIYPDWEFKFDGSEQDPCCETYERYEGRLGSHYHCANCGEESSMMGHFTSIHWTNGKRKEVPAHFHCPGACELEGEHIE